MIVQRVSDGLPQHRTAQQRPPASGRRSDAPRWRMGATLPVASLWRWHSFSAMTSCVKTFHTNSSSTDVLQQGKRGGRKRGGSCRPGRCRRASTKAVLQQAGPARVDAPVLLARLDDVAEVAALAALHDDVDLGGRLVDDAVVVADNKGVPQLAQDVDLQAGVAARRARVGPPP